MDPGGVNSERYENGGTGSTPDVDVRVAQLISDHEFASGIARLNRSIAEEYQLEIRRLEQLYREHARPEVEDSFHSNRGDLPIAELLRQLLRFCSCRRRG